MCATVLVALVAFVTSPKGGISAEYLNQKVVWESCPVSVHDPETAATVSEKRSEVTCATVLVPADYSGKASPDFKLQLARFHDPKNKFPLGSIFINPGGPGGSGIGQLFYSEFPKELLSKYDFIGFDPRAVGFSNFADGSEFKCDNLLAYREQFGAANFANNQAELNLERVSYHDYVSDCITKNPYWWTLTTDNMVKDLEVLRASVTGKKPLNFIGTSYGTVLAARYVANYPEHVGKIVLDSPTLADEKTEDDNLADAKAKEARLNDYLKSYARHAHISVYAAWQRLLDVKWAAQNHELVGYAGLERDSFAPTSRSWFMKSSEIFLVQGIVDLAYYPIEAARKEFNSCLDSAYKFKLNDCFEYYALDLRAMSVKDTEMDGIIDANDIHRDNTNELIEIVWSLEFQAAQETLSESQTNLSYDRFNYAAPKFSRLFNSQEDPGNLPKNLKPFSWRTIALDDPNIPDPPKFETKIENRSGKQVLVVGGIRDSVTPFHYAQKIAKQLGAALIKVDTDQHGSVASYTNDCVNAVIESYFLSGTKLTNRRCPAAIR
jgi:pimeloyl-ACP methyl ester carboxylesterase